MCSNTSNYLQEYTYAEHCAAILLIYKNMYLQNNTFNLQELVQNIVQQYF